MSPARIFHRRRVMSSMKKSRRSGARLAAEAWQLGELACALAEAGDSARALVVLAKTERLAEMSDDLVMVAPRIAETLGVERAGALLARALELAEEATEAWSVADVWMKLGDAARARAARAR